MASLDSRWAGNRQRRPLRVSPVTGRLPAVVSVSKRFCPRQRLRRRASSLACLAALPWRGEGSLFSMVAPVAWLRVLSQGTGRKEPRVESAGFPLKLAAVQLLLHGAAAAGPPGRVGRRTKPWSPRGGDSSGLHWRVVAAHEWICGTGSRQRGRVAAGEGAAKPCRWASCCLVCDSILEDRVRPAQVSSPSGGLARGGSQRGVRVGMGSGPACPGRQP